MDSKKLTREEKEQWDTLYQYVKKEILQYDKNQSIPTSLVLRLKGLTTGKLIANNKTKNKANYSYDIVLKTFQICKSNILNAVKGKTFKNEMCKFVYIAAIVENNINDVYLRLQNVQKAKEQAEIVNIDILHHEGAEYKTASNKTNSKLEDLW